MQNNVVPVILFLLGVIIGLVISVEMRNEEKKECELNLPRTELCVLTWVPKTKEKL